MARLGAFFRRGRAVTVLPFLRRRREGVSGVVAASLGVVLISVLLGMVVTFWVPAWGYDNEVEHSREAINAFGQFKSALEILSVGGNTNETVTTSFPVGVGGVPMFGAETPGQLSLLYLEGGRLRFRANLTDSSGQVNLSAAGSLEYTIPNRYYVRQDMAFEAGGVIVAQPDGQTMRLTPPFRFTNATGGLEVVLTLFSLEGTQAVVAGVDAHTVSSRLSVTYTRQFTWASNTTLTLNMTSSYLDAWSSYFSEAMHSALVNASLYNTTVGPPGAPEYVSFRLMGVRALTVTVSLMQVRID